MRILKTRVVLTTLKNHKNQVTNAYKKKGVKDMVKYFTDEERVDFTEMLSVISAYHDEIRKQTLKCMGVPIVKEVEYLIEAAGLKITDSVKVKGVAEEIDELLRLYRNTERRNRYVFGYLHEMTFPISAPFYQNKILSAHVEFEEDEITLDEFHCSTAIILGDILENPKYYKIMKVFRSKLPDILRNREKMSKPFSTTSTNYFVEKTRKAKEKLYMEKGEEPTIEEISEMTGISEVRTARFLEAINTSVCSYESMCENASDTEDSSASEKSILNYEQKDSAEEDTVYKALHMAYDCIPDEVSKVIIFSRFGIDDYDYVKEDICSMYGISGREYTEKYTKALEIIKEVMGEMTGIPVAMNMTA